MNQDPKLPYPHEGFGYLPGVGKRRVEQFKPQKRTQP